MTASASSSVCPDCGVLRGPEGCMRCPPGSLEAGTVLQRRQLVAALRRRDPLGFRHLGVDQKTEALLTVREYAPVGLKVTRQEDGHLVVAPEDRARWSRGLRGFLLKYDRMAALEAPGLVGVRGKLMANGTAYAFFEPEPGETVGALLAEGERFTGPALESIVQDILQVLAVFHRRGVAHGGIHPWTVALTEEGRARIIDLGWYEPEVMEGLSAAERRLLPPEVLEQPMAWQPAGDLYGVGVLAVILQHGEPVEEDRLAAARGPESPAWLQRLLQVDPGDRPDDADDLLASWDAPPPEPPPPGLIDVLRKRLREVGEAPPPPMARRALLLGAVGLVSAVGAGVAYGLRPRSPKETLLGSWRGAPGGVTVFPEYAGADRWAAAKRVAVRSRNARLFLSQDRIRLESKDEGLEVDELIDLVVRDRTHFTLRAGPERRYELELREGLLRLVGPEGRERIFRRVEEE